MQVAKYGVRDRRYCAALLTLYCIPAPHRQVWQQPDKFGRLLAALARRSLFRGPIGVSIADRSWAKRYGESRRQTSFFGRSCERALVLERWEGSFLTRDPAFCIRLLMVLEPGPSTQFVIHLFPKNQSILVLFLASSAYSAIRIHEAITFNCSFSFFCPLFFILPASLLSLRFSA
jgi:hypothetical protein